MEVKRHLTIREARTIRGFKDDCAADILAIQLACEVSKEEATEFFDAAPAGVVAGVIGDIMERSGLTEGAQFPVAEGDDLQPPREAE